MHNSLVSIILPVHNHADHITQVVDEYVTALSRIANPVELLLVVNGCRDNSLEVCNALASKYSSVRVIFSQKGGWGLAVRLGLEQARGELLCYTNTARTGAQDLQLLILYAVANPGSVVKAHRHSRESLTRKLGSFLFNFECRALLDLATWDVNATPKVFSREIYEHIQPQLDNDLIDLEVYQKCHQLNVIILEVPIYARTRFGGKSTTNMRSALRMYWGALKMWQNYREHKKVTPEIGAGYD